jgi:hypothetical protein
MFSLVAGMHQFYTSALAIPMAISVSWAISALLEKRRYALLTALLVVTLAWEFFVSSAYSGYFSWAPLAAIAVGAVFLIVHGLTSPDQKDEVPAAGITRQSGLLAGLVALAVGLTPAVWSVDTINNPSSINPAAGPASMSMGGFGGPGGSGGPGGMNGFGGPGMGAGMGGGLGQVDATSATKLIDYLTPLTQGSKYVLAVFGAQTSAPIITATGASVLPIGGFDGSDNAPTLDQFKKLVASGDVKYVLLGNSGGMGGQGGMRGGNQSSSSRAANASSEISDWVTANCTEDSSSPTTGLYRCGN